MGRVMRGFRLVSATRSGEGSSTWHCVSALRCYTPLRNRGANVSVASACPVYLCLHQAIIWTTSASLALHWLCGACPPASGAALNAMSTSTGIRARNEAFGSTHEAGRECGIPGLERPSSYRRRDSRLVIYARLPVHLPGSISVRVLPGMRNSALLYGPGVSPVPLSRHRWLGWRPGSRSRRASLGTARLPLLRNLPV
ncbi:hypothetical protein EJ06DRAFT_412554 [Trichodelitschia bisporula]|uniref:Uncharacterized protein n=1 Tax=Trichodelitschia bisporula TaxID=703511 RepID=A0A6G1HY05_9PEZI|nr:hypothetical protein EJ06DRAFT_412554 [Trichodelitschia bisporula]